jgi:two-component system sensor histidine kinase and response regulator WspE
MVRDLGRALGKTVRLEIVGDNTQVDRDILEKLEAPLAHLLRNAVDHGCETPEERLRAGKPEECVVRLEARHSAGMLTILVSDDGAGIHPDTLRETIVRKKLTAPAVAEKLTEVELLDFLLLPGFSMRDRVTEISGRGVGVDVARQYSHSHATRQGHALSTAPALDAVGHADAARGSRR